MTNITRRTALKGAAAMTAFTPFISACAPDAAKGSPASAMTPAAATPSPAPNFMDGVRTAEMIETGEMTALEAVEAAIKRAEAVNGKINAIATPSFDAARAEAADPVNGPLSGVPSFTKDLADRKGEPTFYGSRAFKGYVAPADGPIVAAMRTAGIISLGKSTSPEMGLISSTEPLVTGATRNPWNLDHIPGGSSGGAAALTAARVVPFAHASDGGGSIRIPAACCGLFGLKPSAERLHNGRPDSDDAPIVLSVDLAVTHTVRDAAAVFNATQRTGGKFQKLAPITGPGVRRLKIAFAPASVANTPVAADVTRAMNDAAELCRGLGHEVVDFTLPIDGEDFADKFLLLWSAGAAQFAQQASAFTGKPPSPEILEPWTLGLAQNFMARRDEMPATIASLKAFDGIYHSWFDDFDILLTPVTGFAAPRIGTQAPDGDYDTVMKNVLDFAAFTAPMNVAGSASMSVPLGMSDNGLPIGVMFSGKRGDDGLLLELAYELEQAAPWIGRVPNVVA